MNTPWDQHDPNGENPTAFATGAAEYPRETQEPPPTAPAAAPEQAASPVSAPALGEDPGAGNIDRIRDILFGSQMRAYETRFARLEETLRKESAELRDNTKRTIDRLESYVRLELESLNGRFRIERDERGTTTSQLTRDMKELGEGMSRRMAELDDRAASQHHELREQLLQHGRDFTEQIHTKQQEVAALLEERFRELRKDKTDRAALASLFSEVALRLNNEFHIPGVEH
jgi:hypothetical protein